MLIKGDKVSVLDEAINGVVVLVKNNEVFVQVMDQPSQLKPETAVVPANTPNTSTPAPPAIKP